MSIADKVRKSRAKGSWIRRMFEEGAALKQRYGEENVFDLSLGNPVMEPPVEFKRELKRLAEHPVPGMHRYMENAGYPETRAAVATQLSLETGIKFSTKNIIMTCGAAGALNAALRAIVNPGEDIILFAPYFTEFENYIFYAGAEEKIVPTDETFMPRMDELEKAIGPRTRGVLINSPNNPTAVVYGEEVIRQLAELLDRKSAEYGTEIYLFSDEAYSRIIYDGMRFP